MKMQVAKTILEQLGGNKFCAMVGFGGGCAHENGLSFSFKGCRKANRCMITLNSMDLYDVEFFKYSPTKGEVKTVHTAEGLYNDMLVPEFEDFTGLYTKLF